MRTFEGYAALEILGFNKDYKRVALTKLYNSLFKTNHKKKKNQIHKIAL